MATTSARLLRLLSLLQSRQYWSGPELADRLDVTTRTVRRDVQRLRQLGYPVDASPGETGGYQLGTGGALPPLLLDDDEATAIAVALGVSTGGAVRGIEEPALAALAKLDRLLPPRLRSRVAALHAATVTLAPPANVVDADVLVALAQACDGHERVVITYTDREGRASERRLEPYKLVATGRRWYLLARDVDRDDWRTFRVDRVGDARRTGHRFVPEPDPPDAATMVGKAITTAPYRYHATVSFPTTAPSELARRIPPTAGVVRADGQAGSVLTAGGNDLDALAGHLVGLGLDFEVHGPVELRRHVQAVASRLRRATRAAGPARDLWSTLTADVEVLDRCRAAILAGVRPQRIPPGPGQESVWDYPRPPALEPVAARVRVQLGGVTVADTTRAWRVLETSHPPNYYLHPDDVVTAHLAPVPGGSFCEWKGTASYWTVSVGDRVEVAAAWSYPRPAASFSSIRDHLAFYAGRMDACWVGDHLVEPQPGGFYGGWITSDIVGPFKGVHGSRFW